jgi:hypothetical protein
MNMLVLEFNELCPSLLTRFMQGGLLPNFSRLYGQSDVYTTTTDDEHLEPWVQWVTFHCGVGESIHGVHRLDQGHLVKHPAMWDVLAGQGKSSVVFGAMNTAPAKTEKVLIIPDPWSTHIPVPDEFAPYQEFVRNRVLDHTNKSATTGGFGAFAAFMASHGLSISTVCHLFGQILSERTLRRDVRWRRASSLDYIQWDVFEYLWQTKHPDLAVFFSNSTAFLQHRYWRQMDPDAYEVKPTQASIKAYGAAIRYGYQKMDRLVGRALAMAGRETTVVLVTALSQQPNLRYEKIGGVFVYRPKDFRKLLDFVGIPNDVSIEPVMTHQAWMSCRDERQAAECERALLELKINGEPIMSARRAANRVYFDCKFISQVGSNAVMSVREKSGLFDDYFAFLGEVLNARHHPDGVLWISTPGHEHRVHQQKLNLADASRLLLDRISPARGKRWAGLDSNQGPRDYESPALTG